MTRPRICVTRRIPQAGLDLLADACDLRVWPDELPPPRADLLRAVAEVDGLLCLLTDNIDAALMDAAPNLKVISNFAVGTDNIDIPAATARGLPVGNTPGVLTETTADCAFALLMAAARRLVEGAAYVKAGQWQTWGPTLLMGQDIHGATLGIVGLGRIGQAMAQRARGFDMRVIACDSAAATNAQALGVELMPLDAVLAQSDFLSLHVPLTTETHHLINAAALARMKPTAVLVNTARGGVVDPAALHRALRDGTIAYAALDVTEPEPIPPDDPLLTLDNCLIVPHIASSSHATRGKMATMAAANLLAGLRGERLPNCVNPAIYAT